jgi:hypothetical protein
MSTLTSASGATTLSITSDSAGNVTFYSMTTSTADSTITVSSAGASKVMYMKGISAKTNAYKLNFTVSPSSSAPAGELTFTGTITDAFGNLMKSVLASDIDTTGLGGTIGRAAMFDAGTEAGRQARLRALALQQGYLAQTPAPVGGLDPATAIQAEMAAKAANLQSMQQFQQNVLASSQRFQQSTSDWINQNLGDLAQANQVAQQNKQNYEQSMYNAAVQNAASQNALTGSYVQAGGAVAGAALGTAIII